ncbi:unnamed protein product, partial [Symbiodinium sp. CCMP2456]
ESLASRLKASLEDARRAPRFQREDQASQVSPSLPKGGHLRASKPLEGLTQLVEGRSGFFAELAKSVGYEVQRLLRFTLLGYTNPLTEELERKAQQQISEGLRTVLSHLSTYVDEVFMASTSQVPSQDSEGLQQQLDASISQGQELQEVLAKSDRKLLKSTQLQNKLRSMYYQDLEAQRTRFRSLLSRYLEYFTPEDLEMVHDLMNVRFFNPDSALDEDTEQLLQRKAAALQETFNTQKEGLMLQLAALSREETAMRQKLALEQKKVRLLQARMGEDVDEALEEETATREEDSAGRSHMAFIKITALEDALQQQASWLQDLDRKDKSDALQQFQVLLRLCLEKAAAAKAALDGVPPDELQESSLERQRANVAENFAKLEESKKEAAEKELETMTQARARAVLAPDRACSGVLALSRSALLCPLPPRGVGAAAQRGVSAFHTLRTRDWRDGREVDRAKKEAVAVSAVGAVSEKEEGQLADPGAESDEGAAAVRGPSRAAGVAEEPQLAGEEPKLAEDGQESRAPAGSRPCFADLDLLLLGTSSEALKQKKEGHSSKRETSEGEGFSELSPREEGEASEEEGEDPERQDREEEEEGQLSGSEESVASPVLGTDFESAESESSPGSPPPSTRPAEAAEAEAAEQTEGEAAVPAVPVTEVPPSEESCDSALAPLAPSGPGSEEGRVAEVAEVTEVTEAEASPAEMEAEALAASPQVRAATCAIAAACGLFQSADLRSAELEKRDLWGPGSVFGPEAAEEGSLGSDGAPAAAPRVSKQP